jgi:hypothetical protein
MEAGIGVVTPAFFTTIGLDSNFEFRQPQNGVLL